MQRQGTDFSEQRAQRHLLRHVGFGWTCWMWIHIVVVAQPARAETGQTA
jgi:hypothetical protein